ncbi:MAG: hypothetical protein AAF563_11535 [Pseudomonadota bacterium]
MLRRTISTIAAALIVIGVAGSAPAQEPETEDSSLPSLEERMERLGQVGGQGDTSEDLALPDPPAAGFASPETDAAYQSALQAYYAYREAGYTHRLGVFTWQDISSKIIFVVVIILVFAGIYFAAIQFHVGLRRQEKTGAKEEQEATEFVFSLSEFKVKSPVLGVIVLTISLAFFYLYLVYVYPIVNVF